MGGWAATVFSSKGLIEQHLAVTSNVTKAAIGIIVPAYPSPQDSTSSHLGVEPKHRHF